MATPIAPPKGERKAMAKVSTLLVWRSGWGVTMAITCLFLRSGLAWVHSHPMSLLKRRRGEVAMASTFLFWRSG